MNRLAILLFLAMLAPMAGAQADDQAEQRARLANQRIEAEARAREEQERQAKLAAEREQQEALRQAAQAAPSATPPRQAAAPPGDVERLLEQIRTLGELRDAGYVTEAEFERIKRRILDGAL